MGDYPESSKAADILDHTACIAAERIWGSGQSQSHVVPAIRADLCSLDDENASAIGRRTAR